MPKLVSPTRAIRVEHKSFIVRAVVYCTVYKTVHTAQKSTIRSSLFPLPPPALPPLPLRASSPAATRHRAMPLYRPRRTPTISCRATPSQCSQVLRTPRTSWPITTMGPLNAAALVRPLAGPMLRIRFRKGGRGGLWVYRGGMDPIVALSSKGGRESASPQLIDRKCGPRLIWGLL